MLLSATIFSLVIGAALSAPYSNHQQYHQQHHQHQQQHQQQQHQQHHHQQHGQSYGGRPIMGSNPLEQVQQGFLCDWCVVGVGDGQQAIRENLNQVYGILNRTAQLCQFCPAEKQCQDVFLYDIPAAIQEYLAKTPDELCSEAGLCDTNATIPAVIMSSLNSHVARDREIKRILERTRKIQQELIRTILGQDFLCDTCKETITATREMLLSNETQQEVVTFLAPLCDYMPTEYQADCDEFVQTMPAMMTMIAEDILLDSTCAEMGFCNKTKKPVKPDIPSLPDVMSRLGINLESFGITGVGNGQGRGNFQIPELPDISRINIPGMGRNPFQQSGQGRPNQNPFGLPDNWNPFGSSTGRQDPQRPQQGRPGFGYGQPGRGGGRPNYGRPQQNPHQSGNWPNNWNPFGSSNGRQDPQRPQQGRPGQGGGRPNYGRPQQSSPYTNPWPQKPKPEPKPEQSNPIADLGLDDIFGKGGILDQLPDMPKIPGFSFGFGRRQRRSVPKGFKDKVQDKFPELMIPQDRVNHEYVPGPIPDVGIMITEQMTPENCEVCKQAVVAVDNWLQDNAPQLRKLVSQFVLPICTVFPSPMEEDCVSDVSQFIQTFVQVLVSKLQPEPTCTWLGQCDASMEPAPSDAPLGPSDEVPKVEPTTWPRFP